MTEEEAKNMWCPMYRQPVSGSRSNRGFGGPFSGDEPRCVGSMCMMWRWHTKLKHDGSKFDTYITIPGNTGYCGLAGKPDYE